MDWVARLYPARWRQRYGAEFGALLEESGGGWSATVDILKGALAMQMRSWTVWQFVAGCAMTGAVVAGVASWMAPKQYVSTAVLRVDADAPAGREWLGRTSQEVFSRTELMKLIVSHGLYNTGRAKRPVEDIIQDMRAHITTSLVANHPSVFKVSFTGSSPAQANEVNQMLVSQFIDKSLEMRGALMEVVDPATLPRQARSPNLLRLMAVGVVFGVLLGLLAFQVAVWSRRSANA